MAFRMQAPWKNPRSDNLWFRRRVPSNLVAFMGKREIKFSLATSDPELAKIRFQEENARLERMWHEHRHGQRYVKLSPRQISALAGQFYDEAVAQHADKPGRPGYWQSVIQNDLERIRKRFPLQSRAFHMRETFGSQARAFLDRKGYRLSGETLDMFIEEFVRTKLQVARQLERNAGGDWREDPDAKRFASAEALADDGNVDAMDMFERYADEAQIDDKTRRSWRTKLKSLMTFVGHDDLARLTVNDVIAWKDKLLKTKRVQSKKDKAAKKPELTLDPLTVRNSYLAAVKATLGYAKQQRKLSENVASEVTVRVKKKKKQREKGFTEEEAIGILKATFAPAPRGLSREYAFARRWVPWICAYTGARVNEITQLLPPDFKFRKGIHYIRVDADAAKTGNYREVPLHDHLIEQGLLVFESRKERPLFYNPERSRGGKESGRHFRKTGERLAEWIRSEEVGVTDEEVAPNHGWRHRFSSLARHVGMHVDVQNIVQGHAGDKVASDYGDAWIETAYREIMKIPRYRIAR
jgi:integrase